MKKMTLVSALKDYFGFQPNQTASGFAKEIAALTPEDKAYFANGLATVGYEIVQPAAAA